MEYKSNSQIKRVSALDELLNTIAATGIGRNGGKIGRDGGFVVDMAWKVVNTKPLP